MCRAQEEIYQFLQIGRGCLVKTPNEIPTNIADTTIREIVEEIWEVLAALYARIVFRPGNTSIFAEIFEELSKARPHAVDCCSVSGRHIGPNQVESFPVGYGKIMEDRKAPESCSCTGTTVTAAERYIWDRPS